MSQSTATGAVLAVSLRVDHTSMGTSATILMEVIQPSEVTNCTLMCACGPA